MLDLIFRVFWDNYVIVFVVDVVEMGFENFYVVDGVMNGNYVNIKMGDVVVERVFVLI